MDPITAFLVVLCIAVAAAGGLWVSPYVAGISVLALVIALALTMADVRQRVVPWSSTQAFALTGQAMPDPDGAPPLLPPAVAA